MTLKSIFSHYFSVYLSIPPFSRGARGDPQPVMLDLITYVDTVASWEGEGWVDRGCERCCWGSGEPIDGRFDPPLPAGTPPRRGRWSQFPSRMDVNQAVAPVTALNQSHWGVG